MMETVSLLIAVVLTIIAAVLLVYFQEKNRKKQERLKKENKEIFNHICEEVESLTGEPMYDQDIIYIEKRLDMFNKSIGKVQSVRYKRQKEKVKHVKFKNKKYAAND